MSDKPAKDDAKETKDDFQQMANESEIGLVAEFIEFLKYNKKWWLTPIIVVLLLMALLIFFSGTVAAPFIYMVG